MKRTYSFKNEKDYDYKEMSKKEILAKLNANFCYSFAGVKELEEIGERLYVTYKNNRTLIFKNIFGSYASPVEFV